MQLRMTVNNNKIKALPLRFFKRALLKLFKLSKGVTHVDTAILSLPTGTTCPGARECLTFSDRVTGRITDGPESELRCFAASMQAMSPEARAMAWHNFDIMRRVKCPVAMGELIHNSLPRTERVRLFRFDAAGDLFNQTYFDGLMLAAQRNPHMLFYGYTKSIKFWLDYLKRFTRLPVNVHLVASMGGTCDALAIEHGLRRAIVVDTPEAAARLRVPIDHDDSHVWNYRGSFALLVHGTQRKGSKRALAVKLLKARGIKFSYGKSK